MNPNVLAAATNMINNLNPMAVLQVASVMMVEIFYDYGDGNVNNGHARGGDGHGDHDNAEIEDTTHIFSPDDWNDTRGRRDAKYGS